MKNLQQEIIAELGTNMQSEMDKEILWGMLVKMGWIRVLLPRFESREHAVDCLEWVKQHCSDSYEHKGSEFIFENDRDAVNFILKWK